jgi:hypothetical protein
MTFKTLADVNATTDPSELLIYTNELTDGWAMPSVLFAFFIIVFLGGAFAQMRFRGGVRIDFAFAAASFSTLGLAVIMMMKTGLLNPIYLFVTIGLSILSVVVLYLGRNN